MYGEKKSEAIALTAVSLYTELKSYKAVAHQLGGMNASTVRRYVLNVEKYGIPILPKSRGGKAKIEAIQEKHDHCYGINRVTAALRKDGCDRKPGHNQVARVIAANGLNAVTRRPKNYRVCMKKGVARDGKKLDNILNRQFDQQDPNKVFATDVTYIATTKGWLYVSPVIDLCTREIVACEISMTQDLSLAF